jgi:hypothetical protein
MTMKTCSVDLSLARSTSRGSKTTSFHTGAMMDAVVDDRVVMRFGSYSVMRAPLASVFTAIVFAVFASSSLGCAAKHQEAKVAEADPWAGYKGTYAPGAAEPPPSADDKPKTTAEADTKAEPKPEAKADAKPGKKPKGKRGKKGAADATAAADPPASDKPAVDPNSASALYGDSGGAGSATTTSATDDTAAPAPKKPKKKAAKKKKPAAPAQ